MSFMYKNADTSVTVVSAPEGIVDVIANTGALDAQDDVIEAGAWSDVLQAMQLGEDPWPTVCRGHDWSDVVGKVLTAQELRSGDPALPPKVARMGVPALWARVKFNLDTQRGREAYSDVAGGYVSQWSVGLEPDPAHTRFAKGVRYIGKVRRWPELSTVVLGASHGTQTVAAKAAPAYLRHVDQAGDWPDWMLAGVEAYAYAPSAQEIARITREIAFEERLRASLERPQPAVGPVIAAELEHEAAIRQGRRLPPPRKPPSCYLR